MSKCLVIFVEGETEELFYKKVVEFIRNNQDNKRLNINIECENVKGIGGFKNIALRKFVKKIKPKYNKSCEFYIALCRDTDVFEFSPKPPIDWEDVKKSFWDEKVSDIIDIKAKHCIEDWFLYDIEGIKTYLRLPKNKKVSGNNGYEKLKKLFKLANKMYYKGVKADDMIEHLNIEKIFNL